MRTKTKTRTKTTRSRVGRDVTNALTEVLAHVRGKKILKAEVFPDVVAVRKATGLSRSQFAKRFLLEPRTLQDWEQGRRMPDSAARAYLTAIAGDSKAVERALTSATH
jgi:putative transcriptional regulator